MYIQGNQRCGTFTGNQSALLWRLVGGNTACSCLWSTASDRLIGWLVFRWWIRYTLSAKSHSQCVRSWQTQTDSWLGCGFTQFNRGVAIDPSLCPSPKMATVQSNCNYTWGLSSFQQKLTCWSGDLTGPGSLRASIQNVWGAEFFTFPTPKTQEERCWIWTKQWGQTHEAIKDK